ncbi:MAG TPA: endopeptidase, partial [Myxococcota bacterium]|nr:endopeptidase [Myxococcota bacterium]
SGRDADLAFYLSAPGGGFADPPQMSAVGADGRAGGLDFDLDRNWRLVEAMLTDEVAQVQWIFVANHLRAALLDHGRQVGSPL